jgi:hypothetical protein
MSLNETLDIIIRICDRMNKDITDFFKPIEKQTIVAITESKIETKLEPILEHILEPVLDSNLNENTIQELNNTETTETTEIQETPETPETTETPLLINSYLNSIKKCKKDNLTPKLWNQISLTNIPGVSTNIATKISESYPSLKLLFKAYDNCETDESRIKLISEIILTNNGKTKRRIGEVVSKRILEYLYKDSYNSEN